MTTAQPNLLQLAKQGNPQAIAALMNQSLQSKGITAKVALKEGCLQVMLESAQMPASKLWLHLSEKLLQAWKLHQSRELRSTEDVQAQNFQLGTKNLNLPDKVCKIKLLQLHLKRVKQRRNSYKLFLHKKS